MDDVPQEFMKFFEKEKLIEMQKLCRIIIDLFNGIDILEIDNNSDEKLISCVKNLDSVYYKFTGDEDAIGGNYKFKLKTLQRVFKESKKKSIEEDPQIFANKEDLRNEVLSDVCSQITYSIISQTKGERDEL
jgi:hypothetical protein